MERNEMKQYNGMKPYASRTERRGIRALRQYRKRMKRKRAMENNPNIILFMACGSAMIAGIVANVTGTGIIGFMTFIICMLLCYVWAKGKIL